MMRFCTCSQKSVIVRVCRGVLWYLTGVELRALGSRAWPNFPFQIKSTRFVYPCSASSCVVAMAEREMKQVPGPTDKLLSSLLTLYSSPVLCGQWPQAYGCVVTGYIGQRLQELARVRHYLSCWPCFGGWCSLLNARCALKNESTRSLRFTQRHHTPSNFQLTQPKTHFDSKCSSTLTIHHPDNVSGQTKRETTDFETKNCKLTTRTRCRDSRLCCCSQTGSATDYYKGH